MSSRARLVVFALLAATLGTSAVVARGRRPPSEKYYTSRDIRLYLPKPKDETGHEEAPAASPSPSPASPPTSSSGR